MLRIWKRHAPRLSSGLHRQSALTGAAPRPRVRGRARAAGARRSPWPAAHALPPPPAPADARKLKQLMMDTVPGTNVKAVDVRGRTGTGQVLQNQVSP